MPTTPSFTPSEGNLADGTPRPLDENAMNQLQSHQSELLDKIDELRSIGVGGLVELPQIIVCGNQSSGKSSVLEAISRVRFPAKGNVCTRFATEVVLRRSPHKRIKVSIEPGGSRTDENERQKLRDFSSESFASSADLPTLIEHAKECMGLSDTSSANLDFSDDVLKVEISSPEQPELTLVDLPGLYTTSSQDQSEDGMKVVRKLTEGYMKSSRSIILAIVSAKVDYHLQGVLNIAGRFDPNYERTMGIVTHPDILEAGSDEERSYLQFIKNEKVKLKLGWHVLRNRSFGTSNESDSERDAKEKEFFEHGQWSSLSREQVGVETLRHRLSKVLLNHIGSNLPELIQDIEERISHNEQALAKMGPSRAALQDQQRFLLDVSSGFARITNQALNGSYVDDFFDGFKAHDTSTNEFQMRRLRALIRDLNEYFADAMGDRGCRRIIQLPGQPQDSKFTHDFFNPYMGNWTKQYVKWADLEEEIKIRARQSRGIELPGAANQLLVGSLFRDQSEPWEEIARTHLMNSWTSVEYFTHLVLDHLTDKNVHDLLMRHLITPQLEKLKLALLEKLEELTSYTKTGHPLPVGKSFLSRIQKSRQDRQLEALERTLPPLPFDRLFNRDEVKKAVSDMQSSSDQFAAADIIDQMEAYYDTAIVTFVDNVAILAIENCLLRPFENIFTSQTVIGMEPERIEKIAGESDSAQKERKRLNEELEKLQRGKETLSGFNTAGPWARTVPRIGARLPAATTARLASNSSNPFQPRSSDTKAAGNSKKQKKSAKPEPHGSTGKPAHQTPTANRSESVTSEDTASASGANSPVVSLFSRSASTGNSTGGGLSGGQQATSKDITRASGFGTQVASSFGQSSGFTGNSTGGGLFGGQQATSKGTMGVSGFGTQVASPFGQPASTSNSTGGSPFGGQRTTPASSGSSHFGSTPLASTPSKPLSNPPSGSGFGRSGFFGNSGPSQRNE